MLDPVLPLITAASIAAAQVLAVANIDSPGTELNARAGVSNGALVLCTQNVAATNEWTLYAFDATISTAVNSPYIVAASGSGKWVAVAGKYANGISYFAGGASVGTGFNVTAGGAAIVGGLQVSGVTSASSVTTAGGYTSSVATGTAPFTATSTTVCPNLNVSQLLGSTWAAPGSIGSGTPAAGAFTTLNATSTLTVASDADGTHVVGRTKIGTFVASDTMGFAHFDNANTTDFCLNQSAAGTTNFNAKSGQNCIFTIGGASKMTLNTSSLTLNTGVPLTLSDTTASTSAGTGALIVGGGGGFSGQVNAITFAARHAGSGSWSGTAYSGTDYTASDTASAPFFRAINTNAGGYDSGFLAYQSTSTGVIKPAFLFGCVGTGAWTNGTVGSQTSDMYFLLRDNADAMIERLRITNLGNVILGKRAALATNATDGFTYVSTCAGTPTGVPTAYTGKVAIVVDTTNHKLYFYDAAWRDAGP